jgi:hypothetical protein
MRWREGETAETDGRSERKASWQVEENYCGKWKFDGSNDRDDRSILLEIGLYNDGSHSFSLSRPDSRKLETEILSVDPSHQGFIDTQRPILVMKKQGQVEHPADLYLGKRCRLTAVSGEIEDRRLALEVIISEKEQTAT